MKKSTFKLAYKTLLTSAALATICLQGCVNTDEKVAVETVATGSSLKDAFKNNFHIGAALSKTQILDQEPGTLDLVAKQFNSLTAENEMKWELMQPIEGQYHYAVSDKLVEFSEKNDIFLVGHTLLWHHQTPKWVFENGKGEPASREVLLKRLETHINNVAGRYKGRIEAWDVVNEALNDDGTWRDSPWYRILGEDYIIKAFEFAAKAAPNAELYYNDYNLFKPEKRDATVKIVKSLQAKGLRIDAVGIQGHYGINYPDLNLLEDSIKAFGALGVKVMLTELDISVLPFPDSESQGADISIDLELQEKLNPFANGLSAEMSQALADNYVNLFKIFMRHEAVISRITFWGVNDAQTWRNDWPMKNRTDYPLLFDRNNQPKLAFDAVLNLAK
ncbi:endo-1,4-beta-xylanase [Algibacillus agarilyticus]|uniref:endo-1,4-beta-xylanase n=1 Tax=Algibacillus agarilyticus TaxID=2234133 RepID=UPI000DD0D900|nr:endo-1,4-beta-xylanase [Algibacillus agarilyticus]